MSSSPIVLGINADVSQFQSELAGKGAASIKSFITQATQGFEGLGFAAEDLLQKVVKETSKVSQELEKTGHAAHHAGGRYTEAYFAAEIAIERANRGFGLGLARHLETQIASMASVQTVVSGVTSAMATLTSGALGMSLAIGAAPVSLALASIKLYDAIERLGESYRVTLRQSKEYNYESASSIGATLAQTAALVAQNDKLDIQIARIEHRPTNGLKLAIDESIQSGQQLTVSMEAFQHKVGESMMNSEHHVSRFMSFLLTAAHAIGPSIENVLLGFMGAATGQMPKFNSIRAFVSDTAEMLQVKRTLDTMKDSYTSYIEKLQSAKTDQEKLAITSKFSAETNLFYAKTIEDVGKQIAGMTIAKGLSKGELDFAAPIATLRDFRQKLIAEQFLIAEQRKTSEKQITLELAQENRIRLDRLLGIESAKVEGVKALTEAELKIREESVKRAYAISALNLETETELLKTNEKDKFDAETKANAGLQAIEKQKNVDGLVKLKELQDAQLTAKKAFEGRMAALDGERLQKMREMDLALATQAAVGEQKISEARIIQATAAIKQKIALAPGKTDIVQETSNLVEEENKTFNAKQKGAQKRLAVLMQNGEKEQRAIADVNTEIQLEAIQHQTRLNQINADGQQKILARTIEDSQLEFQLAKQTNESTMRIEQAKNQGLLQNRVETQFKWLANEKAILESWYSVQSKLAEKQISLMESLRGRESSEYRALIREKLSLDERYQLQKTQLYNKEENQFQKMMKDFVQQSNQGITAAIMGTKTWAKAWADVYNATMSAFISYLLKEAGLWALHQAKILIMHKTTKAVEVSDDAAAGAAKMAIEKAESIVRINIAATIASANAYAAYAELPPVAAAMAAEAFATVMSMAAFEKGGIVPNTGIALVHEGEAVLPRNLTDMLQSSASSGAGAQGGGKGNSTFNYTQHIHGTQGQSSADIGKHSVRAMRAYARKMNLEMA